MPQIQLIDQINDLSLYAARAVADENGQNIDSTYAKKSEVPAAQVNADWNASSGVAQILNKPSIPTVPTAGNMLSTTNNVLNVTTTAGITDIQMVQSMPAQPVATVLYLIPEN